MSKCEEDRQRDFLFENSQAKNQHWVVGSKRDYNNRRGMATGKPLIWREPPSFTYRVFCNKLRDSGLVLNFCGTVGSF